MYFCFSIEEKSIVRLVETDYSNYYVHHVETDGAVVNALHLYSKCGGCGRAQCRWDGGFSIWGQMT